MKRLSLIAMMVLFCLVGVVQALNPGWGQKLSVTNPASNVRPNAKLMYLTVYNAGTNDVFAMVNSSTNDLRIAETNGTAVVIAASKEFTFDTRPVSGGITNVVLKTASDAGTNAVYLGGM